MSTIHWIIYSSLLFLCLGIVIAGIRDIHYNLRMNKIRKQFNKAWKEALDNIREE